MTRERSAPNAAYDDGHPQRADIAATANHARRLVSGRVSFVADLVMAHADALRRSAHDVAAADAGTGQGSGVPELGGVDAAFSDVSAAVRMLRRSTGEALSAAGDNLADALVEMISVEHDIVEIIARALGAFA